MTVESAAPTCSTAASSALRARALMASGAPQPAHPWRRWASAASRSPEENGEDVERLGGLVDRSEVPRLRGDPHQRRLQLGAPSPCGPRTDFDPEQADLERQRLLARQPGRVG